MKQTGSRQFGPEIELLLSCVRRQIHEDPDEGGTEFAADELDWDRVVRLARHHRLHPFVCRSSMSEGLSIPPDVRAELNGMSEGLVRRNLYMVSELVELLDRLEDGGIRALTYKGPSLAELAYRDLTLREFVDLDLLVPEENFQGATEILLAGNYVVEDRFPAFGEVTLRERDTGMPVDLHYRVTPTRYPFTFPFDQLWERRVKLSLNGGTVRTFGLSDLLPVVAVHGTRHYWVQLEWLVSFAALVANEPIDWTDVLGRARELGCDRMVLLGLRLSRELLGVSVPEEVVRLVEDERIVRVSAGRTISRVVRQDVSHEGRGRRFHHERYLVQLALMRGIRARVRYGTRIGSSLLANRLGQITIDP